MKTLITVLVVGFFNIPLFAAEVRIPLNATDALLLTVPDGWRTKVRPTIPNQPHTLDIMGKTKEELLMFFTPIIPSNSSIPLETDKSIQEFVINSANRSKVDLVEQDIIITKLNIPNAVGYYFSGTDKNPKPDEWKFMTQGYLAINEVTVTFTILMNGDDVSALREQALTAVKTVRKVKK